MAIFRTALYASWLIVFTFGFLAGSFYKSQVMKGKLQEAYVEGSSEGYQEGYTDAQVEAGENT